MARRNHYDEWTPNDDARLMHMRKNGVMFKKIAKTLGRSTYSVTGRMKKLRNMGLAVDVPIRTYAQRRRARRAIIPVVKVELAPKFFAVNSNKFRRFDDRDALAAFIADHPDYTPAKAMPVKMVPQIIG